MNPSSYLVFSAVGPDRPGLVKEISTVLRKAGANIEDSRMAILGGEFAIILLLSGAAGAMERVKSGAKVLETEFGLHCILKETARATELKEFLPYNLHVAGIDRPGIVQAVTDLLAEQGINVATFESRVVYAPMSGTPMFVMDAELQIPPNTDMSVLRRSLSQQCTEDNLEFALAQKTQ